MKEKTGTVCFFRWTVNVIPSFISICGDCNDKSLVEAEPLFCLRKLLFYVKCMFKMICMTNNILGLDFSSTSGTSMPEMSSPYNTLHGSDFPNVRVRIAYQTFQ